jgi:hypothetical protein
MVAAGILMTSCEHDELPTYNDVDRIYFDYASWARTELYNQGYDSNNPNRMSVLFGYDKVSKTDSIVVIKVKIMGNIASVDRPVDAELLSDESSAIEREDLEILPSVIPAGEVTGDLKIKLKNTEKLQTNTLLARIRLVPNEYFHVDYSYVIAYPTEMTGIEFYITYDAKKEMPSLWQAMLTRFTQFFGAYSNTKLDAICAASGFTREYFEYDMETEDATTVFTARFPNPITFGLIVQLNHYLEDWKAAHDGQPLLDEYGNEVKSNYPTWL